MRMRELTGYRPSIHPSLNIPDWVKVGKNVCLHEGILFTEGFGYARDEDGEWLHIPHSGGVVLGHNVDVYFYTTINRGTVDDTVIGDGTKIDHHCHIGHNSHIGQNCIICAGVIIAGSVVIGNNVWIGPGSRILNKVSIASNTYIGQGTNVVKSVKKQGGLVKGNPGVWEDRKGRLPHNKIG